MSTTRVQTAGVHTDRTPLLAQRRGQTTSKQSAVFSMLSFLTCGLFHHDKKIIASSQESQHTTVEKSVSNCPPPEPHVFVLDLDQTLVIGDFGYFSLQPCHGDYWHQFFDRIDAINKKALALGFHELVKIVIATLGTAQSKNLSPKLDSHFVKPHMAFSFTQIEFYNATHINKYLTFRTNEEHGENTGFYTNEAGEECVGKILDEEKYDILDLRKAILMEKLFPTWKMQLPGLTKSNTILVDNLLQNAIGAHQLGFSGIAIPFNPTDDLSIDVYHRYKYTIPNYTEIPNAFKKIQSGGLKYLSNQLSKIEQQLDKYEQSIAASNRSMPARPINP